MSDTILDLIAGEDTALVFGIQCPYCTTTHLFSALGVRVRDPDLDEAQFEPTITMTHIDEEEGVVHARCLACWETFGLIPVIKTFKDPSSIVHH